MKKMTQNEYKRLVEKKSPNSPLFRDMCFAFLFGGIICCIGQGISDIYTNFAALDKEAAASATSITLIFIGAFLTGLGVYDKVAKYAGAGTIVPITGFANSIVSPAMEFKSEGYVLGMSAKMFTIAGPVLVFGISVSVISGFVLWIFKMF